MAIGLASRSAPGEICLRASFPQPAAASKPAVVASGPDLEPFRSGVLRLRPDQVVLSVLLDYVRAPAGHPPTGKQGHKLLGLESERLQHERSIELHIGLEVSPGLVLLEHPQRRFLCCPCQFVELAV